MAYHYHRRTPSPSSTYASLGEQLVDMAKPLAKPWLKLKGIMGDDSSRKDLIKRMQHRTASPANTGSHHNSYHSSASSALASSDNYYYSSSPHSNNSPTGSQNSLQTANNHHVMMHGASSPQHHPQLHHHHQHHDSGGSGLALTELVTEFAGGGAVSIPFFIPPTRFVVDSARSSVASGSYNSSQQSSPRATASSKQWQKLRLISSVAVRPKQANERRSSVDTRGSNNKQHQGSGGMQGGESRHHDKLRKLRQRPTQFELQVPSLAVRSTIAADNNNNNITATQPPAMLRTGGGVASGPASRMHSPKKILSSPTRQQQQSRTVAGAPYASPARNVRNVQQPAPLPLPNINIEEPTSAPSISINDEFGVYQNQQQQHQHHRHSPESAGGSRSSAASATSSTTLANKTPAIEADDDSAFLGVNTSDSRMRRQSCESKYWDCPEAPAQALMLKIPQRDTMYQRRRSSTFGNLDDLLKGIDTVAAAAGAASATSSSSAATTHPAGTMRTPSVVSTTTTKTSPSNSPAVLRRRPTAAALLGDNSRPSSSGSTSRPGSGSSSIGASTTTITTTNNVRPVRTRHLSVTHVSSSELPGSVSRGRQQSVSPHGRKDSSPSQPGGGRQMSVSVENLYDMPHLLDDNQIALERAESQAIATRGELKLALVYLREEKTLKATVYKAENLGKNRRDISSFVAACLLPGKEQKQQSRVVKSNKNPQYNEEFYFPGHRWHELANLILRISIYNELRVGKECLGEVLIPLGALDEPTIEQRMWRDLRPKLQNPMQDNAFIQLRLCFNTSVKKAIVTVMKVHNVRGAVTFLPDVYVKVEFWQHHKQMDKRTTKVAKRTNNPVFKEAFAFPANMTTKEEMSFTTIKVTLVAKAAIGSDGPIGQVILGYGATEDTENEQWRNAIRDPGKEFTRWHALLPVD